MAVNCRVIPTNTLGLAGVTVIEERVGTVRVVLSERLAKVAVMVLVPTATAVARPLVFIVATDVFDELQVTCVVISWCVPSAYMLVAVNCWVVPRGTLGLAGVIAMEDGSAADNGTGGISFPPLPPPPPVAIIEAIPIITRHAKRK
jgi:hypothetical protein